jgi:6-phosphogluconolactonase/glucosamine-6-phosphate isomerase/deaminase
LFELINFKLSAHEAVVWLLSGGSSIAVATATATLLAKSDLSNLSIGLIDERYGALNHSDSNLRQLESSGFYLPGINIVPVINGLGFEASTEKYNSFIEQIFSQNIYKIGLLGIGSDGHTAGILPDSSAVESEKYVIGYKATDYQRITLTGKGLRVLDRAIVYAAGTSKKTALQNLTKSLPAIKQPAQLLKQIPRVDVYNDVIGESV